MGFSTTEQTTISPHDLSPLVTRVYPSSDEVDAAIVRAAGAQKVWAKVPLDERIAIGYKFIVRSAFSLFFWTTYWGLLIMIMTRVIFWLGRV
jgi:hypothetical protein